MDERKRITNNGVELILNAIYVVIIICSYIIITDTFSKVDNNDYKASYVSGVILVMPCIIDGIRELLNDTKNEILENSYQTTIKEEIKNFILEISTQLSINDLESLYNTKDILNVIYDEWLKYDSPFSTDLENCIFESVEHIKKRYLEDYEK